jgi:hypothetical protein
VYFQFPQFRTLYLLIITISFKFFAFVSSWIPSNSLAFYVVFHFEFSEFIFFFFLPMCVLWKANSYILLLILYLKYFVHCVSLWLKTRLRLRNTKTPPLKINLRRQQSAYRNTVFKLRTVDLGMAYLFIFRLLRFDDWKIQLKISNEIVFHVTSCTSFMTK